MKKVFIYVSLIIVLVGALNLQIVYAYSKNIGVNVGVNKYSAAFSTASSYLSGEGPDKAVDGLVVNNSKWCTEVPGPKWLQVELMQEMPVTRWVVKHAGAAGEWSGWNTKDFELQYSLNGIDFISYDKVVGNTENVTDRIIKPIKAKYFRLYITAPTQDTNPAARIYEFELYNSNNVALLKSCSLGNWMYNYPATNAFDGDESTYWASNYGSIYDYFQVGLNYRFMINKIVVKHAQTTGLDLVYNTRDFRLIGYNNGNIVFTEVITGNTANITERGIKPCVVDTIELRVDVATQSGGDGIARIAEIEVFSDTPDSLDIILDNESSAVKMSGSWTRGKAGETKWGDSFYSSAYTAVNTSGYVHYDANVTLPGFYDVYLRWASDSTRNTGAHHLLYYGVDKVADLYLNQTINGGTWYYAGQYYIDRGKGAVRIPIPTTGTVSTDAVRFTWLHNYLTVGATASAESTYPGYSPDKTIDISTNTGWGESYSWANYYSLPQWLQISFPENRTFNHIVLYTTSGYELRDYQIQYWNSASSNWVDIVTVTGNTQTERSHKFNPITSDKVRVICNSGPSHEWWYARINELKVLYTD